MYVHNGQVINKYELVVKTRTIAGLCNTSYYFDTKDDAETYLRFLLQEKGLKEINSVISSNRTYNWERQEYKEFKESIDWEELRSKVKNIKFTKETTFVEMRKKK